MFIPNSLHMHSFFKRNHIFIADPIGERLSDESSGKDGVSDSHPETLTDPEFSDPPLVTSSPPQSGDEVKKEKVSYLMPVRCPWKCSRLPSQNMNPVSAADNIFRTGFFYHRG